MKIIIELKYNSESVYDGYWDASFEVKGDVNINHLTEQFKTKMDAFHAVVRHLEEELTLD